MKKKLVTSLLALCMVLTMLPAAALATGTTETVDISAIVTSMGGSTGKAGPKLHDTRNESTDNDVQTQAIADADLYNTDSYKVTAAANNDATKDQAINVTVTITGLKAHQNDGKPQTLGYWVGVTYPAVTGWTITGYKRDDQTAAATLSTSDLESDGSLNAYYDTNDGTERPVWVTYTKDNSGSGSAVTSTVKFLVDLTGVTAASDKTTITEVTVNLDETTVAAGGTLPEATIASAKAGTAILNNPASILDIKTTWTGSDKNQIDPLTNIQPGTYSYAVTVTLKESANAQYTLAADAFKGKTGTMTVSSAPATPALTFKAVPADTSIFGKTPGDMGTFQVGDLDTKTNTVKVTGAANYIEYPDFSSNSAETTGYYLPIQIKGTAGQAITITGSESKNLTFGSDGSFELAMRLDNMIAANQTTFTVKLGETIFTVDFSDVVLVKTGAGTKVEASTDEQGNTTVSASDTAEKVTVTLPAEAAEQISGNTVKVENKTSFSSVVTASGTPDSVKDVIQTATAGAAVTVTNSGGQEVAVSGSAVITITIKVDDAGTYHVFCIDKDGKVTSFGEYEATEANKTITIRSTHLSQYPAVKITDANRAAVAAAAQAAGADTGKASMDITFAAASGHIGPTATATGLTPNGPVTIQIAGAANKAPAVVFTMTADASGKVTFNANSNSVVTVWDGSITFTGGNPAAGSPTSVTKPATV